MTTPIVIWPKGAPHIISGEPQGDPTLTPYLVQSAVPTAAIIVCPGGAYGMLADHEGEPIAHWFNSIGISAFVLKYRFAPYKYPVPMLDAQRAIRYVRHHAKDWNIDAERVGVIGFSAGGHLVSTVGTHYDRGRMVDLDPIERESSRPDLLILCYPVISFGEFRHHHSMINLLGEFPSEEQRHDLSNELQVTADTPPAFLWHTADDEAVSVENSLLFAQALYRNHVPCEMHMFESGPHGMGLAENDASVGMWTLLCREWLKKRGWRVVEEKAP
ncbi:alpha/beta hydrolase [Paenibacillus sp. TAF43_2]|uniref:alpha/beta hydrolase n=1 Tax=Paenibacillus sp. TAF43_2 TaxID=3233069 RepID=UPI003F9B9E5D